MKKFIASGLGFTLVAQAFLVYNISKIILVEFTIPFKIYAVL